MNNTTIKDLWKRVAEDYMPFNINVTTDIKVYLCAATSRDSRQRCCFTDYARDSGGRGLYRLLELGQRHACWSVYTTGKAGGKSARTSRVTRWAWATRARAQHQEYYGGQGSGATGWAPIMGVGYYQPVSTWAKGEYQYANNHEDELNIITTQNNNVTYRPDDTGSTLAPRATWRSIPNFTRFGRGRNRTDRRHGCFPVHDQRRPGLADRQPGCGLGRPGADGTLADASDTVIASNNPQSVLSATISTNLPSGTYTFRVTGAGRNNPLTNGFSAYASLGYYSVAGWVAGGAAAHAAERRGALGQRHRRRHGAGQQHRQPTAGLRDRLGQYRRHLLD